MYDIYQRRIAECDEQLQNHLARFADTVPFPGKEDLPRKKKKKQNKNKPHFHLANELQRITGVDLTHQRRRCASSSSLVRERRLSRLDITAGEGAQKRTSGEVISAFVEVLAITPRNLTDEEKIT